MTNRFVRAMRCFLVALVLLVVLPVGVSAQTTSVPNQLRLLDQTAFVGPTGTFSVEVSTGNLPTSTTLNLVLHGQITSRSRLNRTIAGEQLGTALFSTPRVPITAGGSTKLALPLSEQWPAPDGGTVLTESGVYPIQIEAIDARGSRLNSITTHLLRLPSVTTPTTPLAVAATVIIDAPLDVSSDGTPQLSQDHLDRARQQFQVLSRAGSIPLTLAATPFVVQSVADSGEPSIRTIAPERQTLSRPFVSIDAGSLDAAGRGSTIAEEFTQGDNVIASIFESAPDHRTLVLDQTVTPSALNHFAQIGAQSVVLQSSQIRSSLVSDGSAALTNRFIIESENNTAFAAMANDDVASSRFILNSDPILGAHHALAEVMMLHEEQPGPDRGVALTIPAATDVGALTEFLGALADPSGMASGAAGNLVLQPVSLEGLFTRTAIATNNRGPIVRSWTSDEPSDLGEYPLLLEQSQWNLIGLRSMLPDGAELITPIERTVLASADVSLSGAARAGVLNNAAAQLQALTSAITLPTDQKVTLTSSSGKIPLVITNALPIEAMVRITVRSPKLEFPEGTTYEIALAPSTTTRTDIEVTTKASGAFPLDVTIASAGGGLPVTGSRIDVRSTAISGFGLFLSIGAGVFLLVWWGRHFRHTRRARALVATDEPAPSPNG
jgi:hypothetical protein